MYETDSQGNTVPFVAHHPGAVLADELLERDIDVYDFADRIGVNAELLTRLFAGYEDYTPELAEKLEAALGIEASMWMRLQDTYDEHRAIIAAREAARKLKQKKSLFPRVAAVL